MDLLAENDGRNFLYSPFSNYADGNLDACGEMLAHPLTLFGLGDGGAHVGLISDASFPTYALSHWARYCAHGCLPVGQVVQGLTSATATAVDLHDRGVVAEGMRADLNVIDFAHLSCAVPVMAYDLPAGGKRLLQGARGPPCHCRGRGDHLPGRGGHRCPARAPGPGGQRHRPHPAGLVTNDRPTARRWRGAVMTICAFHELEPAAEWRAGDVADPAAWTLDLGVDDHAELDAALVTAKRKSVDPLELERGTSPCRAWLRSCAP